MTSCIFKQTSFGIHHLRRRFFKVKWKTHKLTQKQLMLIQVRQNYLNNVLVAATTQTINITSCCINLRTWTWTHIWSGYEKMRRYLIFSWSGGSLPFSRAEIRDLRWAALSQPITEWGTPQGTKLASAVFLRTKWLRTA